VDTPGGQRRIGGDAESHLKAAQNRILKGEKPTYRCRRRPSMSWSSTSRRQKALGLEVPPALLARADEVIE